MTSCPLQIEDLSDIRQNKVLFKGLSFALHPGELILVEGENGSGKTTLLRLLTGMTSPVHGEIRWMGKPIQTIKAEYKENLHYLGHSDGVKLGLTVSENAKMHLHLRAQPNSSTLAHFLTQLHLDHHRQTEARDLSKGQKRRLGLLKLLITPAPLWLLDEPFTSLDLKTEGYFIKQLHLHLAKGGMAIVSAHQAIPINHHAVKIIKL